MAPMTAGFILFFLITYLRTISVDADFGDCSECGIRQSQINYLVISGKPIRDTKEFPWLVSLRVRDDWNNCAATILDEYFILTAAHCVLRIDGDFKKDLKVYFQTECEKQMSKGAVIEKVVVHPKYERLYSDTCNDEFTKYDIALIKLKEKIKCDMYKRPICLPSPNLKISPGETNFVAGWGISAPDGMESSSEVLQYGVVKHLNFEKCIKAMPETEEVRDHTLCVGGTEQTVCKGDSGGPLIDKINSKYTVVGVSATHTSISCHHASPVIYTNVAKFINWIKEQQRVLRHPNLLQGREQTERNTYLGRRNRERKYNRIVFWKK